jgi:hypothetical protein
LAHDGLALFLTGWAPHDAEQVWGADLGGAKRVRDEILPSAFLWSTSGPT